jgi:hypothetical protein
MALTPSRRAARHTPGDLADEILANGGSWFLDTAIFRPPEAKTPGYVSVSLFAAAAAPCWSNVSFDKGALQEASGVAGALKRSGYEIPWSFFATGLFADCESWTRRSGA